MSYERELEAARAIAQEAGSIALRYQAKGVTAEIKEDLSPVTIADRECEALIVQRLAEQFPDDGLLGEEGAMRESRSGRRWIIDPIDGTRDFVRGNPRWGVLLALEVERDQVAAGVAHFPALDAMYFGLKGGGAYRNDTRIHASQVAKLSNAVVCVNGLIQMHKMPFQDKLISWMSQLFAVRSYGGGPDAMELAAGTADAWIEPSCKAWDLAPLQVIVEEAGARFFNFDGGRSLYTPNCIICTPGLENAMREFLGLPAVQATRA